MPVTVEIDGIGDVELDDSFLEKDPAEQEAIISQIVSQVRQSQGDGGGRPKRNRDAPETHAVLKDIISSLYPHAKFTSGKRTPEHNRKVGGVENSYHVSGHGVDLVGLDADERAALKTQLEDMGIQLDEYLYHKVKGGGLHLHIGTTHVPEELFPDYQEPEPEAEPETVEAPSPTEQASTAPPRSPQVDQGPDSRFFGIPSLDELGKGLEYGAGSVVEGVGDAIGVITNPLATVLGRQLGYDGYTADLGGDLRDGLGLDRPEEGDTANRITGDIVSGAAGGLGFSGGASLAGRAARTGLVNKALAELGRTPVRDAIAGGSAALAGDVAEAAGAGAVGQTAAALAGGALGYGSASAAKALTPEARATRFASKRLKESPDAAHEAEAALMMAKVARDPNVAAKAKTRKPEIPSKVLNSLDSRSIPGVKRDIESLGLPKQDTDLLNEALEGRYSLTPDEVDGLIGGLTDTPAGQAVAHSIKRVQAIRRLTEPHTRGSGGAVSSVARSLGTLNDFASTVVPYPGNALVSRYLNKTANSFTDEARARLAKSKDVIARERGYRKLQEMAGPSGYDEARANLRFEAEDAIQASEAEKAAAGIEAEAVRIAKSKEAAWRAKQQMEGSAGPSPSRRRQDEDRAWNSRTRETTISDAQKRREEDAAWREVEEKPQNLTKKEVDGFEKDFQDLKVLARDRIKAKQAALKASAPKVSFDPPKPAKPASVRDQLIEKAMAQGVKGTSRTREVFRERLGGVSDEQLDAILDTFVSDNPYAADEAARIRMNQPTKDKRFGSAADPLLKSAMEKLGIKPPPKAEAPASIPVDEAAQSRLDGTGAATKPASQRQMELEAELEQIDPVVITLGEGAEARGTRGSELPEDAYNMDASARARSAEIQQELHQLRQIRPVDRPIQHAEGKRRYQAQANDAIDRMRSGTVNPDALGAIGNAPIQMRDNFKTTEAALRFMDEKVIPDLRAEGFSNEDIDAVRSHLSDIAHAKPYYDEAAYNEGLKVNKRGRPRKEK